MHAGMSIIVYVIFNILFDIHNNKINALLLQEKELKAIKTQFHKWYLEQKQASEDEIRMVRLCICSTVCYVECMHGVVVHVACSLLHSVSFTDKMHQIHIFVLHQ